MTVMVIFFPKSKACTYFFLLSKMLPCPPSKFIFMFLSEPLPTPIQKLKTSLSLL